MAQTLTKPVFLDETGQDIVGKLDDIKQAIANISGDFNPLLIKITTQPTKTSYLIGETLDLTGIAVSLVGTNGAMIDVTSACTFAPANGTTITSQTTSVTVSYVYPKDSTTFTATLDITIKELSSIEITTPPTKTTYIAGEELDLTGIVVTATFDDSSTAIVTSECEFSPEEGDVLTESDTEITVSLTMASITKTDTQSITVREVYGVEWDGTSTSACTRTDSAADFTDPVVNSSNPSSPFDTIMPWSGIQEKTVSFGNRGTGYFVEIPKFYYKWTRDGDKMKLQISMYELDGFHVSPAHADRGDGIGERDYVYVGKYHSSQYGVPRGDQVGTASSGRTRANARTTYDTLRTNNNINVFMWDYAMWWTINMLYLVEFADWDSSTKIGIGCYLSGYSSTYKTSENSYQIIGNYHTGYDNSTYTVQYRYITNLWANLDSYIDGIRIELHDTTKLDIYGIKNPNEFSDTTGGVALLIDSNGAGGYITKWTDPEQITGFEYALLPSSGRTTDNPVSVCDYTYFSLVQVTNTVLKTAYGNYQNTTTSNKGKAGLFAIGNMEPTNPNDEKIGTRAMILPPSRIA